MYTMSEWKIPTKKQQYTNVLCNKKGAHQHQIWIYYIFFLLKKLSGNSRHMEYCTVFVDLNSRFLKTKYAYIFNSRFSIQFRCFRLYFGDFNQYSLKLLHSDPFFYFTFTNNINFQATFKSSCSWSSQFSFPHKPASKWFLIIYLIYFNLFTQQIYFVWNEKKKIQENKIKTNQRFQ